MESNNIQNDKNLKIPRVSQKITATPIGIKVKNKQKKFKESKPNLVLPISSKSPIIKRFSLAIFTLILTLSGLLILINIARRSGTLELTEITTVFNWIQQINT